MILSSELTGNVFVLDGLDGSGKGSCAKELARNLDGRTLLIEYPQYDRPWGKVLRHFLQEDDEGLSIGDHMLAYALNRLETIADIKEFLVDMSSRGKRVNLVFDRFFTSNIIYHYCRLPLDEV